MTFKFFADENVAQKLPGNSKFLAGVNHKADIAAPEAQLTFPWLKVPEATWLGYSCRIECTLDTGLALHKPLPQSPQQIDTLATYDLGVAGSAKIEKGENLVSAGTFTDIIQRMGTSEYQFTLIGEGMRAGFQVPVPGLVSVAGVPAIPIRQWVRGNQIVGNFYGIPLFYNAWELVYVVTLPPRGKQLPPPNQAMHIAADQPLPDECNVAIAPNDYNAVAAAPPQKKIKDFLK